MDKKTVRDVLGEPEYWPNYLNCNLPDNLDMRGATILDVIDSGSQIAVHTTGAPGGETFSVFTIADRDLRERTVRALRVGAEVHEAVAAAL